MTENYIDISYSDDGGHNWSNPRKVDLGTVGSFNHPCRIRRLGMARNRIWRFEDSSPFVNCPMGANVQAQTE